MTRDPEDQKRRNIRAHRPVGLAQHKAKYHEGSFDIHTRVKPSNLLIDDLVYLKVPHHLPGEPRQRIFGFRDPLAPSLPTFPARVIDCLCKPDEAEEIIGDLVEGFARRASSPRYRKVWLWFQVALVVYERAMKLLRLYTRARAGK
jgi:hypothetical protein